TRLVGDPLIRWAEPLQYRGHIRGDNRPPRPFQGCNHVIADVLFDFVGADGHVAGHGRANFRKVVVQASLGLRGESHHESASGESESMPSRTDRHAWRIRASARRPTDVSS